MIDCEAAVRQLWEYVDGDLDATDRERVGDHLALCRRCCGEAEFTAALRDLLRSTAAPELPPDVAAHMDGLLGRLEGETP